MCLGQVACQPALALAQGLGMGVDALHLRELQIVPEEQGLLNGQQDLRGDAQGAVQEGVEGGVHDALGSVLHGHHAIVGLTPLHRLEDGGNGPLGQGEHGQAEL